MRIPIAEEEIGVVWNSGYGGYWYYSKRSSWFENCMEKEYNNSGRVYGKPTEELTFKQFKDKYPKQSGHINYRSK